MLTIFTTSPLAAAKMACAWTTPVGRNPAQISLPGGDLALAGRCVR